MIIHNINIFENTYIFNFLQSDKNDGQKCQMFMDPSGDISWTNITTIQMIAVKDIFTSKQDKHYSIPCQIFIDATPSMIMQITACHLQLMIIVGRVILKMIIQSGPFC